MEMAELGPVKEDKRILCKYGENCYQKNLAHHTKFKHPPRNEQVGNFHFLSHL